MPRFDQGPGSRRRSHPQPGRRSSPPGGLGDQAAALQWLWRLFEVSVSKLGIWAKTRGSVVGRAAGRRTTPNYSIHHGRETAEAKVVVLVGNRCFRRRRVMSGELGQVRTRSASCISTCISIVLWIHPRALPGYAIEASPGIAPGPCSAPLAVPFSRPPGPRQPPPLAPAAGSSELPTRGARRPGSGAAVALAAV